MTNGKTILVVDDESLVRVLVKRILFEQGFRVLEAASGEQALQILNDSASEIDLLLTDLKMPGMHGLELARRARQLTPTLAVLYMSGYSEELKDLNPDEFLEKPFNRNSMIKKINLALTNPPSLSSPKQPVASALDRSSQGSLLDDRVARLIHAEWELARKKV